jgi:hypothetical protein
MAIIGGDKLSAQLVITKKFYEINDLLQAFQIYIKNFYALDVSFPERAKNVFTFMVQKFLNCRTE